MAVVGEIRIGLVLRAVKLDHDATFGPEQIDSRLQSEAFDRHNFVAEEQRPKLGIAS